LDIPTLLERKPSHARPLRRPSAAAVAQGRLSGPGLQTMRRGNARWCDLTWTAEVPN